jgi:hypothetical protein
MDGIAPSGGGMGSVGGFGGAGATGSFDQPAAATGGSAGGPGSMRDMFSKDTFQCASGGG